MRVDKLIPITLLFLTIVSFQISYSAATSASSFSSSLKAKSAQVKKKIKKIVHKKAPQVKKVVSSPSAIKVATSTGTTTAQTISHTSCGPLTYSLGTIDSRFTISSSTVIAFTGEAATIWSSALNKNIFNYKDKGGDITINFIYDTRQQKTDALTLFKSSIDQKKSVFNQKQIEYSAALQNFQDLKNSFDRDVASYTTRVTTFNNTVSMQLVLSQADYTAYMSQKAVLDNEQKMLILREQSLQTQADVVNNLGTALTELAADINNQVALFNAQAGQGNETFQEGEYVQDQNGKHIDVFEYKDVTLLKRLLAHELGHALGMEHVLNENSLLYSVNSGSNLIPTNEDLAELKKACK